MNALKAVSLVALATTLVPTFLLLMGKMDLDTVKMVALIGTVVWFAVTPIWMGRTVIDPAIDKEVQI